MILATENIGFVVRLATVVAPVGIYFLILGLLNSRRHPQLLSGRQDFSLLIVSLGLLFLLPLASYIGLSPAGAVLLALAIAAAVFFLSPQDRTWVIYNLPRLEARWAVARCLRKMGIEFTDEAYGFSLAQNDATVRLSEFPLLRNVTVRLRGGQPELARQLEHTLEEALAKAPAETSPMALCMMLLATGMLVAPVTLMVQSAPQIARLIVDMMK